MTIRFEATEITKAIETARMFGAADENAEELLEKFEEAGKKPEELQYGWGHITIDGTGIEMQVLPGTMSKVIGATTMLAPSVHKIIGIVQMVKPIIEEFAGKLDDFGDKITNLFKTPCINAIYDFDYEGRRVSVAVRRNDVPNGTEFITARINDGDGLIDEKTIRREIEGRQPVFADTTYSKDNELHSIAYDRALHLVRRYKRDELKEIVAENGWKSVKDIAESFKAYDIYAEDEKTAHRI